MQNAIKRNNHLKKFIESAGRLSDFGVTRKQRATYQLKKGSFKDDVEATKKDWQSVGDDIYYAMRTYDKNGR
ncbi:hypothetical protein [Leuconostoc pseudomesenteroides]|uniref:hypothetical protein n=1 Tax=Leuconostoc pseudomesenteroides TaxID=33968 RepID=UPI0039EB6178